jgi:hypothetical protein
MDHCAIYHYIEGRRNRRHTVAQKSMPSAGKQEVENFIAGNRAVKGRNIALADVDVPGFPKERPWRPSGGEPYPNIPNIALRPRPNS